MRSAQGNRKMLTMECSKVMKKNPMIGIHIAIPLPLTCVEIIAPTTPVDTIQLHSMPRTNRVSMPAAPYCAHAGLREVRRGGHADPVRPRHAVQLGGVDRRGRRDDFHSCERPGGSGGDARH